MQRYVWPWFVKVKEDGDVRHIAFPPTPLLPWLPDLYMRYAVLPIFWFMQSSVTLFPRGLCRNMLGFITKDYFVCYQFATSNNWYFEPCNFT
jgi:hypothetical protein